MDEKKFRKWMERSKDCSTTRTYISRCLRVEKEMGIDLDEQYSKDQGTNLMYRLKYSRKEERLGELPRCGITFDIDVDIYAGMHSIRASVKKYFQYLQDLSMNHLCGEEHEKDDN